MVLGERLVPWRGRVDLQADPLRVRRSVYLLRLGLDVFEDGRIGIRRLR